MKKIDLIIAVRDEEENLKDLYNNFLQLSVSDVEFGLIFIEDGSRDNTLELLREFSDSNKNVKYFSLLNPYGQGFALSFGITKSGAEAVITMDGDGSHPFEVIELMIKENQKGYNVVQGHRIVYEREKSFRKYFSYIFNGVFSLISGVNLLKQNVHFRLMDRNAINLFINNKRWWHSVRVNFKDGDIKSTFVEFTAPERILGESKFNFIRLFKIAVRLSYNLVSIKRFIVLSTLIIGVLLFISYLFLPMIVLTPVILINFYFYFRFNNDKLSQYKILENG